MRSLALLTGFLCSGILAFGQFTTPDHTNATVTAGEYGIHTDGANQQSSGANTWYMTWDDTYLYIAVSGGLNTNNDAINLFIDVDPVVPVNGPNNADGTLAGDGYDQVVSELPFRADFYAFVKANYNEWKTADGAGGWGIGTTFSLNFSANANTLETRIPWASITGAGRPASFNWVGYLSYDNGAGSNGSFDPVPTANPSVAGGGPQTQWLTHYYTVRNTANGTTDQPFEWISFTYREDFSAPTTGGYWLNPGTYLDITINDNSADNLDNENNSYQYDNVEICNRVLLNSGTFSVYGDLYIGQGSALLPGDNNPTPVSAIIEVHNNMSLYNYGRLDCVPELSVPGEELNRRISFDVVDVLTIEPVATLVGLYRLGDVTIQAGGVMQASPVNTGNADIEFELATLDNNGLMQMLQPIGSTVNVFTRGFMPGQDNQVYFTSSAGTGTFNLNTLIIGTEEGYLRPVTTAQPVTLNIHQNLEIYSNLVAKDGTGELNFAFVGTQAQYIRGSVGETSEPVVTGTPTLPVEVVFHDLTINNNNGLGNNNANADVHFESFNTAGYGNIDYIVEGSLRLQSGDLVTRSRTAPNGPDAVHELTIREGGVALYPGATSDIGGAPSCFVDGPLRREVAVAGLTFEDFPVGKSAFFNGVDVGDYRKLSMLIDQSTAASNVYVAEMFLGDRSGAYAWPAATPEIIANISNIRYWNVQDTAQAAGWDGLSVILDYGDDEYSDAVPAAAGLRIVKEDGAGQWYNIQPLGGGGTAAPNGEITSLDMTGFPISALGDFALANIVGFFNPLASTSMQLEADRVGERVQLRWETIGQTCESADMLRDAGEGMVPVATELNGFATSYEDRGAPAGRLVYRLRGITADGSIVYSNAVEVSMAGPAWTVSHQAGRWELLRSGELPQAEVIVWDLSGKKLGSFGWESGLDRLLVTQEKLPAGRYVIQVVDGYRAESQVVERR